MKDYGVYISAGQDNDNYFMISVKSVYEPIKIANGYICFNFELTTLLCKG